MKNNILKITISTGILATVPLMVTNAVAFCNNSSPACPVGVTTDITLSGDCRGPLKVTGNDVTVNLGGHTVCNSTGVFHDGIEVLARRVTIKNGASNNNGGSGVWITQRGVKLENVTLSGNGYFGAADVDANNASITHSTITNNLTSGIDGFRKRLSVSFSNISNNQGDGIQVRDNSATILWNTVNFNSDDGIDLRSKYNTVRLNRAYGNGDNDLRDSRLGCSTNTWFLNFNGTSNQPCAN